MNRHSSPKEDCLLYDTPTAQLYEPHAEDILTDESLLDVFRIIKQQFGQHRDPERIAKLLFCISYGLGEHLRFHKPVHENKFFFKGGDTPLFAVRLPNYTSCCIKNCQPELTPSSSSSSSSPLSSVAPYPNGTKLPAPYLTNRPPLSLHLPPLSPLPRTRIPEVIPSQTFHGFRPIRSANVPADTRVDSEPQPLEKNKGERPHEVLVEPKQRGFYYQNGRIEREPESLRHYANQGVLTQASLLRKRRHQMHDTDISPYELSSLPPPAKKAKIPHRHGEFEQRSDKIIERMKTVTMADLEQKLERTLPDNFKLAIEELEPLPATPPGKILSREEAAALLDPALRILTSHSNQKPHLDNGMNQNGIYYNTDYFQLYLAFHQFQRIYSGLFPNEVRVTPMTASDPSTADERDRERNANMKAYRPWIEPLLTETNWAAFRRNIVVGERIMQLTKAIGQGVLLMTKELSGSKLHLTFTNNEWDDFVAGLESGRWGDTLLSELQRKFESRLWFRPDGSPVSSETRRKARDNNE